MTPTTIAFVVAVSCFSVASSEILQAICQIKGSFEGREVRGNITFSQDDNGPVNIWGKVVGLREGNHGFHVHEKGDLGGNCAAAAGHYNPYKKPHGGPTSVDRHVGDLGNIKAGIDETSTFSITDSLVSLRGPNNILGRSIVIHSDPDDLGEGPHEDSKTTGHAGKRVACCVIGVLTPVGRWPNSGASSLTVALPIAFISIVAFFLNRS